MIMLMWQDYCCTCQRDIERYVDYPGLGRFVMRDGNYVVGVGVVKTVVKELNWAVHKGISRTIELSDISIAVGY